MEDLWDSHPWDPTITTNITDTAPSWNSAYEWQASETITISIGEESVTPDRLTIEILDTVVWTNDDVQPHNVTADDGSFDSGSISPGDTFTFTFLSEGNWTFKDQSTGNPQYEGRITVGPETSPTLPDAFNMDPNIYGYSKFNFATKESNIWHPRGPAFTAMIDGDLDGDGIPNFVDPDNDNDGTPDSADTDDDNDGKNESDSQSKGPKPSDWRHGPAQYWYDMLNLPENIEKFDYNLQIADAVDNIPKADEVPKQEPETSHKLNDEVNDSCKIEFPPDAFLMVTQLNWEEDVIWNGDDIKHKVLQKLNSKTNAAGWVPSSFNRTAGAFSGSQGSNKAISGLPGVKLQTMQHKKPTDGDDTWNSIFPVENEELSYDYGFSFDCNYKDHVCKCGSKNCVGFIVREGSRWRIPNIHK